MWNFISCEITIQNKDKKEFFLLNTEIWDNLSKTNLDYHKQEQKQNTKGYSSGWKKRIPQRNQILHKERTGTWNVKYVDKNKRCLFPMLSYIP